MDDAQTNGGGLMIDAIPRSARANLRTTLAQQCAAAGGQAQWGRAHGFSRSYVCELLSGRRDISDGVAIALGFLLVETVIPVKFKPTPSTLREGA